MSAFNHLTNEALLSVLHAAIARSRIELPSAYTATDWLQPAPGSAFESRQNANAALRALMEGLTHEALDELLALAWTGRGDTDETYEEHLEHAQLRNDPGTVGYLAGKGELHLYLLQGLRTIGPYGWMIINGDDQLQELLAQEEQKQRDQDAEDEAADRERARIEAEHGHNP